MKSTRFKLGTQSYGSPRNITVAGVVALLVITLMVGLYIYKQNLSTSQQQETQKQKDEAQTGSAKKEAIENNTTLNGGTDYVTKDEVPVDTESDVVITNAAQSNGQVTASARVSGSTSPGACVFTFSIEGDKPVVRELNANNENGMQTCSTSIPDVEFSRRGVWNLNVTFYSNNKRAETNYEVTVN